MSRSYFPIAAVQVLVLMQLDTQSGHNQTDKGRSVMWIALVVLFGAIVLGAAGQVCLKLGLTKLGAQSAFVVVTAMFRNWYVLAGFVAYGLSSLLYLLALSRLDLSYAYPFVAISYVLVAILAWLILNEAVPPLRVLALAIICIGVVILALSYRGPHRVSTEAASAVTVPRSVDQG